MISRAKFLQLSSAFALGGCRSLFTGDAEDFDDSLTVLFSDAHVSGSELEYAYTREKLSAFVTAVLHRWSSGWFSSPEWGKPKPIWRKVSLPSVGYWGDIGWAEMVTTPTRAEITLKINDFYCARPCVGPFAEVPRPPEWHDLVEEKCDARCLINLKKTVRF